MFKGKVLIQKLDPETGQVYTIEKEFDNPEEYQKFIMENSVFFDFVKPKLYNFNNLLETFLDIINKHLSNNIEKEKESDEVKWLPDISFYENELNKIREVKERKQKRLEELEKALEKLKKYKEEFIKEWRYDIVERIEKDIKKVKRKIEKIKRKLNNNQD